MTTADTPTSPLPTSPLHDVQQRGRLAFGEVDGWLMPRVYENIKMEYLSAKGTVGVMDRSNYGRLRVSGAKRFDLLNRLTTNDLRSIGAGQGARTALLTDKGRVIDDLRLTAREDSYLLITSPGNQLHVKETIERLRFRDDVTLEDITGSTAMISLFGPQSARLLESVTRAHHIADLPQYHNVELSIYGASFLATRGGDLGGLAFDLVIEAAGASRIWSALLERGGPYGVSPVGEEAWEILRVEAGMPRFGRELTGEHNPLELRLDDAISWTKGCYVGQEVVARLDSRQKVSKLLVGLWLEPGPVPEAGSPVLAGAVETGRLTSVVPSLDLRRVIGLGFVRNEHSAPGTRLVVSSPEDRVDAEVAALPFPEVKGRLEAFFQVREAGSTFGREVAAGLTTFLAMAYIVFVNPAVLSQAGMDFGAVFTATCLSAAFATLVMAVAANYPIALAPGMGQNFFFLSVVLAGTATWRQALAAVFVAGLVFVALTLTRVRRHLIEAIPESLKAGIAVGIGLFIALLGLVNAGLVRQNPAGLLRLGELFTAPTLLAVVGLLVTAAFLARGRRGALLWGIGAATLVALSLGLVRYQGFVGMPPSLAPTFLKMDLAGVLTLSMAPVILVFLYMALFDALGTLVAVGQRAGLVKDGHLIRGERALAADAAGTVMGAALGTSTVTAYVESAAGVEAGGRTGLASLVTGSMFLVCLFTAPIVRMVGGGIEVAGGSPLHPLTAPALILVGALMARGALRIAWDDLTEALPAFLVMAGIPFTMSIADGLAMGLIAYPCLKVASGRWREAPPLLYALGALFMARYMLF